jgi:anti-sigma-K factor RskA
MSAHDKDEDARQALAGEYVLGTLSGAERAGVASRLATEPALREAVDAWEARLLPLTALAPPVEPSPALRERILRSIAQDSRPSAAPARTPPRVRPTGWWNHLPLWRGLTGAGFACAAVLASVLLVRGLGPPQTQYLVVLVAPQSQAPGWVVQVDGRERLSLVPLGTVTVPADKALQFWTKADRWTAPVSLGLVEPGKPIRIPVDRLPPLETNQLFELTLEPATGSPTGRPTGPIQFIGRAVKAL